MSVFGHVCMHSFGCQQYSFFHHIPFKRKSNIVKSEWPAIAITTKFYSSQGESLAFSSVSAGSRFLPLPLTLSSLLTRKNSCQRDRPQSQICDNLRVVIVRFFTQFLQNQRKHAKCKKQKKYFKNQHLWTTVSYVFVILAIFFGPLSASNLDPDIEAGSHVLALAQRDTDYLQKPLTYPNCSEDFDCPEDQVCKFQHQKTLVLRKPQVLVIV